MADEITHRLKSRSMWDGSVIGMCGQKFAPGYYRESWSSLGRLTCPGCRKATRT